MRIDEIFGAIGRFAVRFRWLVVVAWIVGAFVAVGGDDALAAIGALDGYEGYLIRADGGEADTGGVEFVS